MTKEQAEFVKKLICDGYSWRAVARDCHAAWKGDWSPPSNQVVGQRLVTEAADLLDEDRVEWEDIGLAVAAAEGFAKD